MRTAALCALAALSFALSLEACGFSNAPDNRGAIAAMDAGHSGVEVVVEGQVVRVMRTRGGPSGEHERFVVALRAGADARQVLISDNVSIAQVAPVRRGDDVVVKGQLEVDRGGPLIHWTHHDPAGRHEPGFIKVHGAVYE